MDGKVGNVWVGVDTDHDLNNNWKEMKGEQGSEMEMEKKNNIARLTSSSVSIGCLALDGSKLLNKL